MSEQAPDASKVIAQAIVSLQQALRLLDAAGVAQAAVYVSHALALIDGTGGALPDDHV